MLRRVFTIVIAAVVLFLAYEWLTFPDVAALAKEAPQTTAFMERRRAELRDAGKSDELHYRFVPYGQIASTLRRAVLVAEDDDFYHHDGVDVKGMKEALEKDWKRKKITHGGSTITQQLAKNLYLSPSRNPFRKVKEYFIARALEKHLTKKRILELYLNVVEMGERVYGAEAASRFYFHKSASSLSTSESALLAGCLPNPRIMNPGAPNKRLRWRQRMILSRMRRWGYLLEKEVLTAKKPEAPAAPPVTDTDLAPPAPGSETSVAPDANGPASTDSAPTDTAPPATDSSATSPPAPTETAPPQ